MRVIYFLFVVLCFFVVACGARNSTQKKTESPQIGQGGDNFGTKVVFETFNPVKNMTDPGTWGHSLTDIASHFPDTKYNEPYSTGSGSTMDLSTKGHEDTHIINNFLSDPNTKPKTYGYYLRENRAIKFPVPANAKIEHADTYIPSIFHKSPRYDTYITGKIKWNKGNSDGYETYTILYLFDEWVAYVNDSVVIYEIYKNGKHNGSSFGGVTGVLDFMVYGMAAVKAITVKDPGYLAANPNFKEFFAWLLLQSKDSYKKISVLKEFELGAAETFKDMKNSSELKNIIIEIYGQSFADNLFSDITLAQR